MQSITNHPNTRKKNKYGKGQDDGDLQEKKDQVLSLFAAVVASSLVEHVSAGQDENERYEVLLEFER